jgi:hypothetical protein
MRGVTRISLEHLQAYLDASLTPANLDDEPEGATGVISEAVDVARRFRLGRRMRPALSKR